jgi:hypothetical protein
MGVNKVLFIGIGFYDYEEAIKHEFKKLDYVVDYFCEVPPYNLVYRFHSRRNNEIKLQEINKHHALGIANHCGTDYDLVFIIKCENMTIEALDIIKNKNPKAKFVLYLWDSIKRIHYVESKFTFFSKIYSFDRLDCLSNDLLSFNPLFFRNEYVYKDNDEKISWDIYHLGWCHSDRLKLIKKLAGFCNKNNMNYKLVLFTGWFSYFMQTFFGGDLKGNKKYLIFNTVSAQKNHQNICRSKATLDIAHPLQSGLTMRTIELLGMRKKIITTNDDIVNYDFYHPNNVLVLDRENPILDKNFFEKEYSEITEGIVSKYFISNWLSRMIG